MSSPRKQQKKHKRASTKARQNRITRNNVADAPTPNNPDALSPDTISMEEFFEGGMEINAFDDLFNAMAEAEPNGLQALTTAFLEDSPLPLVVDNYPQSDVEDLIISLWVAYYEKHHSLSEDDALALIERPEFIEAYQAAADEIASRQPG
jgi:hypothetical protein